MLRSPKLSQERLKELLSYNPETGEFHRRRNGKRAGYKRNRGYVTIMVDREAFLAHRLAIFYTTGQWPDIHVDHADGNPSNNAIANLRQATRSQNLANRSANKGKTLPKGVFRYHDRWKACIKFGGKTRHIGCYLSIEGAQLAYLAEARSMWGEYAKG